jgi:hypothetical protein
MFKVGLIERSLKISDDGITQCLILLDLSSIAQVFLFKPWRFGRWFFRWPVGGQNPTLSSPLVELVSALSASPMRAQSCLFLIITPEHYLVRSTNIVAPHYNIFSSLLLLPPTLYTLLCVCTQINIEYSLDRMLDDPIAIQNVVKKNSQLPYNRNWTNWTILRIMVPQPIWTF